MADRNKEARCDTYFFPRRSCISASNARIRTRYVSTLLACVFVGFAVAAAYSPSTSLAEDVNPQTCPDAAVLSCTVGNEVRYRPVFFSQYSPVTARDMVRRVPGFTIDSGDNSRGFGSSAGNVLINGQRPSMKSSDINTILDRIAADNVRHIELIRGDTAGLDVGGRSVVVNVSLTETGEGNSVPWKLSLIKRVPKGGFRPEGEISYSGELSGFNYTVGAEVQGRSFRFVERKNILRRSGVDEFRFRRGPERQHIGRVNLSLERPFSNGDLAHFNLEGKIQRNHDESFETRLFSTGGQDLAYYLRPRKTDNFEIGADYDHGLTDNLDAKIIALFSRGSEKLDNEFELRPTAAPVRRSIFHSDRTVGETIGRVEIDWSGWKKHTVQFGGEIARNFIDSKADLQVDSGTGMLVAGSVFGTNTLVAELRGVTFVKNNWRLGSKFTLNSSFNIEVSRIAQSGDVTSSRVFVYPKPSVTLVYSHDDKTQIRLSAKREVNQLDLDLFVSAVDFNDQDVNFGNPNLAPQRSWVFESTIERRFGEIGVVSFTGFYNVVQDVEDLLPITGTVEVRGNIGKGKKYGGKVELTAPLDWMGLKNARLEADITLQNSIVTDPVTGVDRPFSFTPNRTFRLDYRQDFPKAKISWGWNIRKDSERLSFGLDEFSAESAPFQYGVYVETTAIRGLKIRLEAVDATNHAERRDRTVFNGSRALNAPLFDEYRQKKNGGDIKVTFSGAF